MWRAGSVDRVVVMRLLVRFDLSRATTSHAGITYHADTVAVNNTQGGPFRVVGNEERNRLRPVANSASLSALYRAQALIRVLSLDAGTLRYLFLLTCAYKCRQLFQARRTEGY